MPFCIKLKIGLMVQTCSQTCLGHEENMPSNSTDKLTLLKLFSVPACALQALQKQQPTTKTKNLGISITSIQVSNLFIKGERLPFRPLDIFRHMISDFVRFRKLVVAKYPDLDLQHADIISCILKHLHDDCKKCSVAMTRRSESRKTLLQWVPVVSDSFIALSRSLQADETRQLWQSDCGLC